MLKFDNIALGVRDLRKSIDFYQKLGAKLVRASDSRAVLALDEGSLGLFTAAPPDVPQPIRKMGTKFESNPAGIDHIAISTNDVESYVGELVKKGLQPEFPTQLLEEFNLICAGFRDPDGNIIYVQTRLKT